jgi:Zn-finger nucleic acid-binding protein
MSDRIEAFRFIKTSTGIDMQSIGCDNHWGYSHVHHDDFGEYEINDTFNGIWIDMVNEKSFLVREIPQEKFDRANAIVNEIMDEAEKRENEFKKKQKEFGLLGEK